MYHRGDVERIAKRMHEKPPATIGPDDNQYCIESDAESYTDRPWHWLRHNVPGRKVEKYGGKSFHYYPKNKLTAAEKTEVPLAKLPDDSWAKLQDGDILDAELVEYSGFSIATLKRMAKRESWTLRPVRFTDEDGKPRMHLVFPKESKSVFHDRPKRGAAIELQDKTGMDGNPKKIFLIEDVVVAFGVAESTISAARGRTKDTKLDIRDYPVYIKREPGQTDGKGRLTALDGDDLEDFFKRGLGHKDRKAGGRSAFAQQRGDKRKDDIGRFLLWLKAEKRFPMRAVNGLALADEMEFPVRLVGEIKKKMGIRSEQDWWFAAGQKPSANGDKEVWTKEEVRKIVAEYREAKATDEKAKAVAKSPDAAPETAAGLQSSPQHEERETPGQKKRRGRKTGYRDPRVEEREKKLLDSWDAREHGDNKSATAEANGFDRSNGTHIINEHERRKRGK